MINRIKKNYIYNYRFLFIIESILFGLCFVYEVPHGDDITLAALDDVNVVTIFNRVMKSVNGNYASSLTGFLTAFLNNMPRFVFVIAMMITMYILLETLRYLFSKDTEKEKYLNVFILFAALSYSFVDMQSAGWIVTTCCYLVPAVFSIVALIPIKKIIKNELFKPWEYFVSIFAIVFSGNQPQGMALQLICYFAVTIYCLVKKKNNKFIYVCFIITIINALFTFTSGWHLSRGAAEAIKWMPAINMYNLINKLDIGLSSSFGWLFFGDNLFTFFTLATFTFLIFTRYNNTIIRIMSCIPEVLCFLFRKMYMNNMSINAFEIKPKDLGTSNFGLFNLESINSISTYLLFFAICIILILIIVEIYLLIDDYSDLIQILVLLAAGFGSRMALAFTPNVFASAQRTFIYLDFCVIITCIKVYTVNINYINEKVLKIVTILLCLASILPLGYFFAYVYNYRGRSLLELFRKK